MVGIIAKNWVGFYESVKKQYGNEEKKLKEVSDPYEQWKIQENLKILNTALQVYTEYLKDIGTNQGFKYLRYLEVELHKALKANKNEVYRTKLELYNKLYLEFKAFRVAE